MKSERITSNIASCLRERGFKLAFCVMRLVRDIGLMLIIRSEICIAISFVNERY